MLKLMFYQLTDFMISFSRETLWNEHLVSHKFLSLLYNISWKSTCLYLSGYPKEDWNPATVQENNSQMICCSIRLSTIMKLFPYVCNEYCTQHWLGSYRLRKWIWVTGTASPTPQYMQSVPLTIHGVNSQISLFRESVNESLSFLEYLFYNVALANRFWGTEQ